MDSNAFWTQEWCGHISKGHEYDISWFDWQDCGSIHWWCGSWIKWVWVTPDGLEIGVQKNKVAWQHYSIESCNTILISLYESTIQLLRQFMDVEILYIPQNENQEVNGLAQHASKYKELEVKSHEYE